MKKVRFYYNGRVCGDKTIEEIREFDDDASYVYIQAEFENWLRDHCDAGWVEEE